ncbi:MAG TPA: prepilin-type N-terminal cleavage/methylation domain-containing protein [Pyrinomonadaceae bacterium]|jgi:Tfp pilus assembly protein PilV
MKRNCNKLSTEANSHYLRGCIRPDGDGKQNAEDGGFTLLEAVIAMLLMTVIALGSASLFSYSIYNNSGASDRATSIAIAQEALELLRSAQFNATTTDATLAGGTTSQTGIIRGGRVFDLTKTIDDDPATAGVQTSAASNFKSITVTVVPQLTGRGWVRAGGGTVTLTTQRSRTDR